VPGVAQLSNLAGYVQWLFLALLRCVSFEYIIKHNAKRTGIIQAL
jgi:hypothetical protein